MDNVEKTSAGWLLAGILVNGRNEMASTLYCTVPRTHPPIGTIKVSNYSTIITFFAKSLSNVNYISYCSRFFLETEEVYVEMSAVPISYLNSVAG